MNSPPRTGASVGPQPGGLPNKSGTDAARPYGALKQGVRSAAADEFAAAYQSECRPEGRVRSALNSNDQNPEPSSGFWSWAREDLNLRPRPYQATSGHPTKAATLENKCISLIGTLQPMRSLAPFAAGFVSVIRLLYVGGRSGLIS